MKPENKAAYPIQFIQSFIQGNFTDREDWVENNLWQLQNFLYKILTLVLDLDFIEGYAEGHCSEIKGFVCIPQDLHVPN